MTRLRFTPVNLSHQEILSYLCLLLQHPRVTNCCTLLLTFSKLKIKTRSLDSRNHELKSKFQIELNLKNLELLE